MASFWTVLFLLALGANANHEVDSGEGSVLLQRTAHRSNKAASVDDDTIAIATDEGTQAVVAALDDTSPKGQFLEVFEKARTVWADVRDAVLAQMHARLGIPQKNMTALLFFQGLSSLLIWGIVAFIYDKYRYNLVFEKDEHLLRKMEQMVEGGAEDFHHGLFGCLGDCKLCLLSFFCFPIRWADTLDKTNPRLVQFWVGFAVMVLLICFSPLSGSLTIFVAVGMAAFYRQQLRIHFGIKNGGVTWAYDLLTYFCCSPCAATQEARQVEACYSRSPI
eukprot:gnl/TRDRNA2_/TRDRNA2_132669_c0_seq1.p1 gnl/TRDRNA2_/TRDRNA2_132669_c0~~gnl/TRDRNA2_/TRDRNA2_132669_c0_seq1.p1  ORF type:complete len:277 (-),score=41.76 gnl/TRDRNA2_/TRDRNA2_132669_c0_seq1:190-1020(-)